jgi:hypothetical protein
MDGTDPGRRGLVPLHSLMPSHESHCRAGVIASRHRRAARVILRAPWQTSGPRARTIRLCIEAFTVRRFRFRMDASCGNRVRQHIPNNGLLALATGCETTARRMPRSKAPDGHFPHNSTRSNRKDSMNATQRLAPGTFHRRCRKKTCLRSLQRTRSPFYGEPQSGIKIATIHSVGIKIAISQSGLKSRSVSRD